MNETKQFATLFITDLVNREIIAKEVNGTWTLVAPILSYAGNVSFHSKDELIQKVTAAAMNQYGSGLKAAV